MAGDVADQNEMNGNPNNATPNTSAEQKKATKRQAAVGLYTYQDASSLSSFNLMGLGATPGSLDEEGVISGNPNLIYENGKLMVKTEAINSFLSIFQGQEKTAQARSSSFVAQDTLLNGKGSNKGVVLGGVI